jgi:hypothetical protein
LFHDVYPASKYLDILLADILNLNSRSFTSKPSLNRISTIKNSSTSLSFHTGVQAVKPDITIEDFQNNNEQVLFYTGLPDFETFNALFESLKKIGADRMNVDDCSLINV